MSDPSDTPQPPESGAHTDFQEPETYGDYLQLDALLACQQPKSGHHDEMMFVIIHQATELWMKLILHEIGAATVCVAADDLEQAQKMLARVSRIEAQLIQSWDVLSTLTTPEYLGFRDYLNAETLCLIEWPERAADYLQAVDLEVAIDYDADGRRVALAADSDWGRALLSRLS